MITCIIIDDENKAREAFEKIALRYLSDKIKILYSASSIKEGVHAIHKYNPQIVFLDIEMPEENGFKLFEYFDTVRFEVVFLTAFQNYAINAIKYAAFDYILKPLNFIDLRDVILRYEKKQSVQDSTSRVQTLLSNLSTGGDINSKVALPTLSGFKMEKISHIVYCEANENYTKIYTAQGEMILVSKTLKFVEDLLPPEYFFRIHKSFLVNLNYIKEYDRTEGHRIKLENGTVLDVATRRIDEFVSLLTKKRAT
jgi:two-component system LytT family response regulator